MKEYNVKTNTFGSWNDKASEQLNARDYIRFLHYIQNTKCGNVMFKNVRMVKKHVVIKNSRRRRENERYLSKARL